jgi:hypothetical protein
MSGSILAILGCWLCFVFSHLWQQSLWAECEDALQAASDLGLQVHKRGLLPRWKMSGLLGDKGIAILWCTGLLRSHSIICIDGQNSRFALLCSSQELNEALGSLQGQC